MHTFTPSWAESWREAHDVVPHAHTFIDATDLIAFAEFDRLTLWRSWPEIWHLDSSGAVLCSSRGLSTDTVRSMADDPRSLLERDVERNHRVGLRRRACAARPPDHRAVDPSPCGLTPAPHNNASGTAGLRRAQRSPARSEGLVRGRRRGCPGVSYDMGSPV